MHLRKDANYYQFDSELIVNIYAVGIWLGAFQLIQDRYLYLDDTCATEGKTWRSDTRAHKAAFAPVSFLRAYYYCLPTNLPPTTYHLPTYLRIIHCSLFIVHIPIK